MDLPRGQMSAAGDIVLAGEEVVQRQAEAPFPWGDALASIERQDEGQGLDEVRRVAQQSAAFTQGFVNEAELAIFEIAETAVDELGGSAGGAGGEVAAFDE